jgi:hypothetical protein
MKDYIKKLKPKVVLFLVGSNDRGNEKTLNKYDKKIVKKGLIFNSTKGFLKSAANHSEVFAVALNIHRYFVARNMGLLHEIVKFKNIEIINISEETKNRIRQQIKRFNYKPFAKRLKNLIEISKEIGIEPVFITQPALYGNAIDDITNVNLGKIKIGSASGELVWEGLETVNDVIR